MTRGRRLVLPVWIMVMASKPSSWVPKPPGKRAMAEASLRKRILRVKKYLKLMSLGSSAIVTLVVCSWGRRGAARAEDADLADVAVWGEDLEGVAQLLEGRGQEFEIAAAGAVAGEAGDGGHQGGQDVAAGASGGG